MAYSFNEIDEIVSMKFIDKCSKGTQSALLRKHIHKIVCGDWHSNGNSDSQDQMHQKPNESPQLRGSTRLDWSDWGDWRQVQVANERKYTNEQGKEMIPCHNIACLASKHSQIPCKLASRLSSELRAWCFWSHRVRQGAFLLCDDCSWL